MNFKKLVVDLDERTTDTEKIDKEFMKNWLGGRGLGAKLLHEEIKEDPGIDPLSPENPVFITTSPLTGYFPSANRTWVTTLSPLTSYYTTSSGGAHFAGKLREAGYIAIEVKGKADELIYLEVTDEDVKIKSAEDYEGMKVYDFVDEAKERGCKSLCIGPAAERGVKYSGTFVGERSCSRGGTGTVLGEKNFKGIMVEGSKLETPDRVKEMVQEKFKEIAKEREPRQKTLGLVENVNEVEAYPTDNWKRSKFPNANEETGLPALKDYIKDTRSCYKCPIGCWDVMESKYTGEGDGVEYEITWAFGANLENTDEEIIVAANHLCDQYGIDVLNAAGAVAWAKEASKKNLIDYDWKGPESILDLIEKIGEREGIGEILGEGSRAAQEDHGGEFSSDVRGMNLPAYDPRGLRGMSLTYSQGPRYGCHLKAWTAGQELAMNSKGRTSPQGKAESSYNIMVNRAVTDSTSVCSFVGSYSMKDYAEIYSNLLELDISEDHLEKRGNEIQRLERKIDKLRGVEKKNDKLPLRVLEEPIEVNGKKTKIGKKQLRKMNKELYKLREI